MGSKKQSKTVDIEDKISEICARIEDILISKNRSYGNSAAGPVNIFSKASPIEQIDVRIDDKLSRIVNGSEYPGDDTILDLVGYLILRIAVKELTAPPQK